MCSSSLKGLLPQEFPGGTIFLCSALDTQTEKMGRDISVNVQVRYIGRDLCWKKTRGMTSLKSYSLNDSSFIQGSSQGSEPIDIHNRTETEPD